MPESDFKVRPLRAWAAVVDYGTNMRERAYFTVAERALGWMSYMCRATHDPNVTAREVQVCPCCMSVIAPVELDAEQFPEAVHGV